MTEKQAKQNIALAQESEEQMSVDLKSKVMNQYNEKETKIRDKSNT